MAEGYVYLLKAETGHYKIGRTKDPNDRLRTFNVKLPFQVEYEHLIQCNDMAATERLLHSCFRESRINGEWFRLSDDEARFIKSLKTGGDLGQWVLAQWNVMVMEVNYHGRVI